MKRYSMMTFPIRSYFPLKMDRISATPETFVLGYYYLGRLGMHKMTVFFNLAFLLELNGPLDKDRMDRSIRTVMQEEPVLRSYLMKDKQGLWLVERESYHPEIPYVEIPGRNWKEKEEYIEEYAKKRTQEDYNLFNPEIDQCKFEILKISDNRHYLLFLGSHIFFDYGAATSVFSKVFRHYEQEEYHAKTFASFGEFLEEEKAFIFSKKGKQDYEYWQHLMKGYKKTTLKKEIGSGRYFDSSDTKITVDKEIIDRIASNNKTSVFNVTLLAIHMAYAKMTGCYDCGANYIIANRSEEKYRNSAGMLMRMMFNRIKFDDNITIAELQKMMRREIGEEYLHHRTAARLCTISPLMIVDESMSDIAGALTFNGYSVHPRAVVLDEGMVDVFPTGLLCIRIIPGEEKTSLEIMGNTKFYGRHYKTLNENLHLAFRFMDRYPDKNFAEFMKKEINLTTVDVQEDPAHVSVLVI